MVGCSRPAALATVLLAVQWRMSRQSHALLRHFEYEGIPGSQTEPAGMAVSHDCFFAVGFQKDSGRRK